MLLGRNARKGGSNGGMAAVINMNAAPLSELVTKIDGEGLFAYVNDMLSYIGPAAAEHGGCLTGISDTGVSAVFAESCEDALMSSVTICQRIAGNPNDYFNFTDFAVGISYGAVYTDRVGYGDWQIPLTISECTRMAYLLRSLAVKYRAHILITERAAAEIPDFFSKFSTRCLGHFPAREIGDDQIIYDVFDGDPIDVKNSKRRSKLFFETGVRLLEEKNWESARSYFIELIKNDRGDRAAKEFLYLCDSMSGAENGR